MSQTDNRPTRRVQLIQASPLFLDLHADEIALLAELCQEVSFAPGEVVFKEKEPGDSLFVVQEGEVEILYEGDTTERSQFVIARLTRGEFFGEMSMLEKSVRSATVRATTEARLLMLTTEDFYSFAKIFRNGFTVVIINIARTLSQRLRHTTLQLSEH